MSQPRELLRHLPGFDTRLVRLLLQLLLKQPHSTFDVAFNPFAPSGKELFYGRAVERAVAERRIEGWLPSPFLVPGHHGSGAPAKHQKGRIAFSES